MSDAQTSNPPTEPGPFGQPPSPGLVGTHPDIGSPGSRLVALIVVGVLYAVLALAQNLSGFLEPKPDPVGRKPMGGEVAKLFLLFEEMFEREGLSQSGQFARTAATQFASNDLHPVDRLQTVLVLGETEGPDAALDWLDAVRSGQDLSSLGSSLGYGGDSWKAQVDHGTSDWAQVEVARGEFKEDTEAIADADLLEQLYGRGLDALSTEQTDRLRDRYGWLGELATTPADSSARDDLFSDIPWALALVLMVGAVLLVGGLGGLTMLILAAVFFLGGKLKRRFEPPKPGGSVFLETFGVFLAGFGLVHFGSGVVAAMVPAATQPEAEGHDQAMRMLLLGTLIAQWLLVVTIFWPRLRGVSWRGWREAVGWRAPRGVLREVAAGVAGYFAGLPLRFAAMVLTVVLNLVAQYLSPGPTEPPSNPMLELVGAGDALVIVIFLSLATIWAPIVEETLFRGSIYRQMRGRAGAFVCALVTALLFAFMHSYGPLMVSPLIALGFTFAMIREWRGSLIGSMTAHCLHNSTIMVLMLVLLQAMG